MSGMARVAVDRADARRDMGVRQQLVQADVDEQRVAVAVLAVGAGRLQDLGDEMDVVGAVVRQALRARPTPRPCAAPAPASGPGTTARR